MLPVSTRAISAESRPRTCRIQPSTAIVNNVPSTQGHNTPGTPNPCVNCSGAPYHAHPRAKPACRTCPLSATVDRQSRTRGCWVGSGQRAVDRVAALRTLAGLPPRGAWSGTACVGVADARPRECRLQHAAAACRRELSTAAAAGLQTADAGRTRARSAALPPSIGRLPRKPAPYPRVAQPAGHVVRAVPARHSPGSPNAEAPTTR